MFKDISLEDLFKRQNDQNLTLIDVRSPAEFKDATIPGSINIPLFNDPERAEVGTTYKKVSPEAAKEVGLQLFSKKLPDFIKKFNELDGEKVVFCWRGGMRSKTAATVVDLMGVPIYRLEGGIRTYRQWVTRTLETIEFRPPAFVLNGYTGTGKTAILHRLATEGYPVIDLEAMANHRGSIFGEIGLQANNQRKFDSLLVDNLLKWQHADYILLEGESKRIGKVMLNETILRKKESGFQFIIEMPIKERVLQILDDYQPWGKQKQFLDAFQLIKRRIHTPIAKQIETDLHEENYTSAVQLLLQYYYDPLYNYTVSQYSADQVRIIKAKNVEDAVKKIKEVLPVQQLMRK